jgi:hypothetical protein
MLAYDAELSEWAHKLPLNWLYKRETSAPMTESFESEFHVYPAIWMANEWNYYRMARMIIHENVLDLLETLSMDQSTVGITYPEPDAAQAGISFSILAQLASDICASVPFLLEHSNLSIDSHNPIRWNTVLQPAKKSPVLPFIEISAAFTLIWPFEVATSSRVASKEMCEWAACIMDRIERCAGVGQALAVATSIRNRLESRTNNSFLVQT